MYFRDNMKCVITNIKGLNLLRNSKYYWFTAFCMEVCVIVAVVSCSKQPIETATEDEPPLRTPTDIILYAEAWIIEAGGIATTVCAILKDGNGDPMGTGYGVRFEITAAPSMTGAESPSFEYEPGEDSVLHLIEAETDTSGKAAVELFPGSKPGSVQIKATSLDNEYIHIEKPLVTIIVGPLATIVLMADEPTIEVGAQSTGISAQVVDEIGNNLGEGYGVRVEITDAPGDYGPERPSFEYPPSEDSISHIYEGITDVAGRIEVAIFSGYVPGVVTIRATVIENDNISVEELLVMIEPGPPAFLGISGGGPVQSVGDSLYITFGVGIWDRYANPAGFGIPVYLEIEPDSIVAFENIIYSDSNGWASTLLAYTCDHSQDTIQIIVSAGSIADTSGLFPLPVYNGEIYMAADPEAIWIEPPDTVGFSDITIQLLDGLSCEISNGIISFTALVCGQLSGPSMDTTDIEGYAYTEFMIYADQIPSSPPDQPQCTAVVRAILIGYPDIEAEIQIICRRPQ